MEVTEEQLNQLYRNVNIAMKNFPQLRYGQAMFNEAHSLWPEEVNKIRGTNDDCFYNDDLVSKFLSHFELKR